MAISKESFAQLIALQELDLSLDKLKDGMDELPKQVQALRGQLEAKKNAASAIKTGVLNLEKKKKERELEMAQKEEAIKKHSSELNQVKTNEAFRALQQEIDAAKNQVGAIETAILEIMEESDRLRKEEKPLMAQVAAEEKEINGQISVLEGQQSELKAKFDKEKAGRDEKAQALAAGLMRVYDHIRSRGKRNAVVPIDGSNCSACRIVLSPQMIIEATRARELILCESCQRILYLKDVVFAKAA